MYVFDKDYCDNCKPKAIKHVRPCSSLQDTKQQYQHVSTRQFLRWTIK